LGKDPTSLAPIKFQARWPGIMTIMTGIDLLGQYLEGNDCAEGTGRRFKRFLKKFAGVNKKDRNILYQLRNALIHSFGLYTRDSVGIEYIFTLTSVEKSEIIEYGGNNVYIIGDIPLHQKFETAVKKYRVELLNNSILQKNFEALFSHYSAVYITKRQKQ